jgi:hypothetical protein
MILNRQDRTIQRIRSIRTNDVKDIANIIEQVDITSLKQTIRYYPLRFLGDALGGDDTGYPSLLMHI